MRWTALSRSGHTTSSAIPTIDQERLYWTADSVPNGRVQLYQSQVSRMTTGIIQWHCQRKT